MNLTYPRPWSHPLLTAHSGAEGFTPNSQEYIEGMIAAKVDVIEIDVHITSDGLPLLHHDPAVSGGEGEEWVIMDTPSQVFQQNAHLIFLEEAFALLKPSSLRINIDIKNPQAVAPILDAVERHGLQERYWFSGLHPQDVRNVRKHWPHGVCMLNLDVEFLGPLSWDYREKTYRSYLEEAVELQAYMVNMHHALCTAEWVDLAHELNLGVSAWTVDTEDTAQLMGLHGVDAMTTNRPLQMEGFFQRIEKS